MASLWKGLVATHQQLIRLSSVVKTLTRTRTKTGKPAFADWLPENQPRHFPLGGLGSVYDTKIVRRRQVPDPNVPDFVRNEPLRWSDWRMLRDVRRRYMFVKYFPTKSILFTIRKNLLMPSNVRQEAKEEEVKLPKNSSIQHLRHRCIISSRSRGKLRRFKISRHQFRALADYNMLSGVAKACW